MALKKLKCSEADKGEDGSTHSEGLSHLIIREITALKMLNNNSNIVQLLDFYYHRRSLKEASFILSFEYAEGGDLYHCLKSLKNDISLGKRKSVDYDWIRKVLI